MNSLRPQEAYDRTVHETSGNQMESLHAGIFLSKCGRTSEEPRMQDARTKLDEYDCELISLDTEVPAPGTKTVRLMRKSYKPDQERI